MSERLEELDEDLAAALGPLREDVDVPEGVEARLFQRLQSSVNVAPPNVPAAPSPAATTGAPWWTVAAAFGAGAVAGALALQALTTPAAPETVVREVIVEVFPDAGSDAPISFDAGPSDAFVVSAIAAPQPNEISAPEAASQGGERALLMRAQVALTRALASDALAALSEHRGRYPRGQLTEEREALWVQALAASHDARAASAAEAFLARYPSSIFREAVEAAR